MNGRWGSGQEAAKSSIYRRRAGVVAAVGLTVAVCGWPLPEARGQEAATVVSNPGVTTMTLGLPSDDLHRIAEALGHDDEAQRRAAHDALLALDAVDLTKITDRIAALGARPRLAPDELGKALAAFRHESGSRRADGRVDIAQGVLPTLANCREPTVVAAAERVLLARALERIGSTAALLAIADLYAIDGAPWESETRRLVERVGARLGPAMVRARAHPSAFVRRWSRWASTELGFDQPGRAVQLDAVRQDHSLLADTLLAYAAVRQMDAMRVIGSYLGHDAARVRAAAREALVSYGRNAIWVLREQYELVTGESATGEGGRPAPYFDWSSERLAQALFAALDEARLAEVREALEAGRAAARVGDWATMARHYDAVLAAAPELPQRGELAPGYAALAEAHRRAGRLHEAESAYLRATALAFGHERMRSWQAELADVRAIAAFRSGIADTFALRAAAARDGEAAAALDLVTGETAMAASAQRRMAAAGAALALVLAAAVLARGRRASCWASRDTSGPLDGETPEAAAASASVAADGVAAEVPQAARCRGPRSHDVDGDTSPGSMPAPA